MSTVEVDTGWEDGIYHRITLSRDVFTVSISRSPWSRVEQAYYFRFRCDDVGHLNTCLELIVSDFLKNLRNNAKKAKATAKITDETTIKKYPNLCEFFSIEEVDGQKRTTGTCNVFYDTGVFKMFLNDRDTGMYLCVSSEGLQKLWDVAEKAVGASDADWRANKPMATKGGAKKGR